MIVGQIIALYSARDRLQLGVRGDAEFAIIVGVDVVEFAAIAALDVAVLQKQRTVRPLRCGQTAAFDEEFILLGLAADDRMVFEQQAGAAGSCAPREFISRSEEHTSE